MSVLLIQPFVLDQLGSQDKRGLSRLREICSYPVCVQAGSERSKASFQRVICALLHLFGLPSFANTVLSQCYNPIVSVVESSLDMHKVCQCVTDLSKQGSITDSKSKTDASVWQPRTWVQMMQIVVSVLMQLMSRSSGSSEEKLSHMQRHITVLQQAYTMFTSRGSVSGESVLSSSLSRLSRLVASQQGDYQTAQTQAAQSAQLRSLRTQQRAASRISQAEEAQAGPGIHRKQGPRHDNDFARIASISIAPTQEEMLCTVPPYLPRNQAGTVMHLDSASQAAHLDMQFRLFRHDGLGELFTSITAFKESGGIAAVVPNQQKGHRQMPWPQAVQEGTLQVYTNAHVQDLFIPKRGPGAVFMVSFDDLPSKHSKKPQERVEFWKMTKRLQHGTLVQLWTETPSTETDAAPESFHVKIISCIISERHEHLLASRQHNQRPNIGLRLCEGSEMTSLLSATVEGQPAGRTVLLQAAGSSFFALQPFLKA
ncbi:TPA: hypothetical protein ACH3X3_006891 [Trebouxia sp. C0006]